MHTVANVSLATPFVRVVSCTHAVGDTAREEPRTVNFVAELRLRSFGFDAAPTQPIRVRSLTADGQPWGNGPLSTEAAIRLAPAGIGTRGIFLVSPQIGQALASAAGLQHPNL